MDLWNSIPFVMLPLLKTDRSVRRRPGQANPSQFLLADDFTGSTMWNFTERSEGYLWVEREAAIKYNIAMACKGEPDWKYLQQQTPYGSEYLALYGVNNSSDFRGPRLKHVALWTKLLLELCRSCFQIVEEVNIGYFALGHRHSVTFNILVHIFFRHLILMIRVIDSIVSMIVMIKSRNEKR